MTARELIRKARARHGLTQAQLAARARTSQAAVSRIERGLVSPTIETLQNLLELMHEELSLDSREVDYGHDRTLYDQTLPLRPAERIARQAAWGRRVLELQREFGAPV